MTTRELPSRGAALRRTWLVATLVSTVGAFVVTIAAAPAASVSPSRGLQWLLFVASSVHVAATGWFFTVPEVRAHARRHPRRYIAAPIALVCVGIVAALVVPEPGFNWLLLAFFGWQFFHFQKQNLGMAALAGVSARAGSVTRLERHALMAAGCAGIAGLLVHPDLLDVGIGVRAPALFGAAAVAFVIAVLVGLAAMVRRPRDSRPWGYCAVYLFSLVFFLPVFVFSSSYAAVGGIVVAHGGQYLVIVGLVAAAERADRSRTISLALLVNIALIGGLALNAASHLHGAELAGRAVFGCYLGAVMAHFVVDAGLWRLRDEFPRSFLRSAVPYLLNPE
ncbi:MAG: hypothetical protein JWM93_2251 [Frankiales bacterium]|nr:hypothetical protein [Frankiales bacterium]